MITTSETTEAGTGGFLARLLEEARRRDIDVAQDSKLRLALLLTRYAEAGLAFADAEEAGVAIAGVLARSTRDERALRELVAELWHPPRSQPPEDDKPKDPAVVAVRKAKCAAWVRTAGLSLAPVVLVACIGIALWWYFGSLPVPVPPPLRSETEFPPLAPSKVFTDLLLRIALAAPCLLAAWIIWMRRPTEAVPDAAPRPGAIARWLPQARGLPLFSGLAVRRNLERLRRPLRIRSRRIDVKRSIRATARAGGVPCLSFEERRVALDCVVLVERAGRTDHVAALGGRLAAVLRDAGAQVLHYEFTGSPATVARIEDKSGARGAPVAFDRFAADHARARLLMLSSGSAFLDPRTPALAQPYRDALDAFAQVYLLSPAPRRFAGGRMRLGGAGEAAFRTAMAERAFGFAGARVVSADPDGIAAVAASALAPPGDDGEAAPEIPDLPDRLLATLDARPTLYRADHPQPAAPDNGADTALATEEMTGAEVAGLVAALRSHMGSRPAFRLLVAVLIYPRLHPDLTVAIAESLSTPSDSDFGEGGLGEPAGTPLTEDIYLRIARLPWGQQTKAPAWLRLALARALTDPERMAVARALDRVTQKLAPNPATADPERVVLTPDDAARIGHPDGVPSADPVFEAFRTDGSPLHVSVLAPRTGNSRLTPPLTVGRWAAIASLAVASAGTYLYAQAIVTGLTPMLAGPAAALLAGAASVFGGIAGLLPGVFASETAGRIYLGLALLLGLLWLLFPFRIPLKPRTYREPDVEAINRVVGNTRAAAKVRATQWLDDAGQRLRGSRRPEVK
ncbi:hypothetical protein [Xanthobacter wiegelii]|uniref:hypothetical protein n=1 Tax=Xanthobacter wiegelii TaxID=3119913 RepID=UPI0037271E50